MCFESRPITEGTPVLKAEKVITKPGMAKNVYKNFLSLNQHVDFYTNVEDIRKVRVIDSNNRNIVRIDYNDKVKPCDVQYFYTKDLKKYDCVVISDYDKGYVSKEIINYLTKNFDGKIFVDSKKKDLSCYENCIIKINEHECTLVKSFPNEYQLIVTLGKNGAKWKNKHFKPYDCQEVKDICGAGDTFFASFVISYLQNKSYEKSIRIANQCASYVLKYTGNHCVTADQFHKSLFNNL
jgi:D-glycero-beta-D-manno-heptose-7-phosphate kinase